MATIFEKDIITIPQNKYEELIRISQKYDILYSVVLNRMKSLFDDILIKLEDIDLEKYNKLKAEMKEDKSDER